MDKSKLARWKIGSLLHSILKANGEKKNSSALCLLVKVKRQKSHRFYFIRLWFSEHVLWYVVYEMQGSVLFLKARMFFSNSPLLSAKN